MTTADYKAARKFLGRQAAETADVQWQAGEVAFVNAVVRPPAPASDNHHPSFPVKVSPMIRHALLGSDNEL